MKQVAKMFLYAYQMFLSPLVGGQCRFTPSCSQYALGAMERHSFAVALRKIVGRLCRCHPWNEGGVDNP